LLRIIGDTASPPVAAFVAGEAATDDAVVDAVDDAMRNTPPGTNTCADLDGTNGAALLVSEREGVTEPEAEWPNEEAEEDAQGVEGEALSAAFDRRLMRFTAAP